MRRLLLLVGIVGSLGVAPAEAGRAGYGWHAGRGCRCDRYLDPHRGYGRYGRYGRPPALRGPAVPPGYGSGSSVYIR